MHLIGSSQTALGVSLDKQLNPASQEEIKGETTQVNLALLGWQDNLKPEGQSCQALPPGN